MLLLPLIIAGCLSATEPPETLLWEGQLEIAADGPADLIGSAAMVAYQFRSEVGVGLEGAVPGTSHGWRLWDGTCDAPGEPAGPTSAFPALEVTIDGEAEAAAVLQRRLTGTEYAVQVVENADGTGAVIACADLTRRT